MWIQTARAAVCARCSWRPDLQSHGRSDLVFDIVMGYFGHQFHHVYHQSSILCYWVFPKNNHTRIYLEPMLVFRKKQYLNNKKNSNNDLKNNRFLLTDNDINHGFLMDYWPIINHPEILENGWTLMNIRCPKVPAAARPWRSKWFRWAKRWCRLTSRLAQGMLGKGSVGYVAF